MENKVVGYKGEITISLNGKVWDTDVIDLFETSKIIAVLKVAKVIERIQKGYGSGFKVKGRII